MSWRDYFEFSKSERRGIIVLVLAIVLVSVIGRIVNQNLDKKNRREIEELVQSVQKQNESNQIENIQSGDSTSISAESESDKETPAQVESNSKEVETEKKIITRDINKVNAPTLINAFGIDAQMAFRIVKYRESLGGFYHMNQLEEVFDIQQETVELLNQQLLISKHSKLTKLAVNQLSAEELKQHPYISPKLADQIVNYRTKVTKFEKVEDLQKLYFVDDVLYSKLAPYISIN